MAVTLTRDSVIYCTGCRLSRPTMNTALPLQLDVPVDRLPGHVCLDGHAKPHPRQACNACLGISDCPSCEAPEHSACISLYDGHPIARIHAARRDMIRYCIRHPTGGT